MQLTDTGFGYFEYFCDLFHRKLLLVVQQNNLSLALIQLLNCLCEPFDKLTLLQVLVWGQGAACGQQIAHGYGFIGWTVNRDEMLCSGIFKYVVELINGDVKLLGQLLISGHRSGLFRYFDAGLRSLANLFVHSGRYK